MPKTKNAFALRGFDEARILQRNFFQTLYLPKGTDEEILQKMGAKAKDNFEITQQKLDAMGKLLARVAEYQQHIKRHGNRLARYARAVEYKITTDRNADISALRTRHDKAIQLSMDYCGLLMTAGIITNSIDNFALGGIAVDYVGRLCDKVAGRYKQLDEKIKTHYRNTFATRLKEARKEMGLTQTDFGFLVGLSQRAISNFENADREPSIAALVKISKRTKRPIDWLLGAI